MGRPSRTPAPLLDGPWTGLHDATRRDVGLRRSRYLTTSDGTALAVDVTLPSSFKRGERLPTMLRQTRYFRSVELPSMLDFEAARDAFDIAGPTRERFLAAGYAWVDVDVRGSGVSAGSWPLPWSPGEVKDGADVVDWIVKQPWSNGRVGSTGISYEGTTAEMLLVNHHEAVKAVAPRFALYCAYEDVAFPGGANLSWFTDGWSRFNALLDAHEFHRAMAGLVSVVAEGHANAPGLAASLLKRGLAALGPDRTKALIGAAFGTVFLGGRRVDEDPTATRRRAALLDHRANGNVHALVQGVTYRDESRAGLPENSFLLVSPKGHAASVRGTSAAVLSYGGFLDGAYGQAAARRHRSIGGTALVLGPWGHAGVIAHPGRGLGTPTAFPHDAALIEFFDGHLKDGAAREEAGPRVRFFTMGANVWRTADTWPPKTAITHAFSLTRDRTLDAVPANGAASSGANASGANASSSSVELRFDPSVGTGVRSRWRGVLAAFVGADYPDLAKRFANELAFETAPFDRARVLTGHASISLRVRSSAPDAIVMAYLLAVSDTGEVHYVTEGHLRALHRDSIDERAGDAQGIERTFFRDAGRPLDTAGGADTLRFSFLPTSFEIPRGYRVRLVLTLGDADHFAPIPEGARALQLEVGVGGASRLELPLEEASVLQSVA